MKILDAIARADALYPNSYTQEEKLEWCYEVTATVAGKVKKRYASFEFEGGEEGGMVPPSAVWDNIVSVYVNGVRYDKADERSFRDILMKEGTVKVIYRVIPEPYHIDNYEGKFLVDGKSITIPGSWYGVGDRVRIVRGGDELVRYVAEVHDDTYIFMQTEDFPWQGEQELSVHEILTAETPMEPPHDSMYIDYILGKIAFYQNDYEEYNKHMGAYNGKLADYEKWYKQTAPVEDGVRFRKKW